VALYAADFLAFPLPETPYQVFANPPFNRTSAIVTRLTAGSSTPDDAYLLMQREAAERFLGAPRGTLYAALLLPWFEPTVVHRFHRADFTPVPRVDVVLLRLRKRGPPLLAPEEAQVYRDFVAHCFTAWKPALADTLAALVGPRRSRELLLDAAIDPGTGPAGVRAERWLEVFARFTGVSNGRAREVVAGTEGRLRERQARLRKVHRTRSAGRRG
jgi:23S rRNA (adenine-N6)-dimethyltransferase